MDNLAAALVVTLIGMSVIFAVLAILWITIVALDWIFPYRAPQLAESEDTERVAVIQAAITAYLKRRPADVKIKSIK